MKMFNHLPILIILCILAHHIGSGAAHTSPDDCSLDLGMQDQMMVNVALDLLLSYVPTGTMPRASKTYCVCENCTKPSDHGKGTKFCALSPNCFEHSYPTLSHRQKVPQKHFVLFCWFCRGNKFVYDCIWIAYDCSEQLGLINAILTKQRYLFISFYNYCWICINICFFLDFFLLFYFGKLQK